VHPLTYEQEARLARDAQEVAEGRGPHPDHLTWCVRLRGPVDPGALAAAVDAVVERHVALGLHVATGPDGEPGQAPAPVAPRLERVDWTAHDGADVMPAVRLAAAEEVGRRFAPGTPLSRWQLHALGPDDHVLLVVADHLVLDAVGLHVVLEDLHRLYLGAEAEAPALQFTDFAAWQRAAFADVPPPRPCRPPRLALPFALGQDPRRRRRGAAYVRDHLEGGLLRELAASAARQRATPAMALATAYLATLRSLTEAPVVAIASAVANRWRPELARCVGWLAHYVVIAAEVDPRERGSDAIRRGRQACAEAYEAGEYPYALAAQRTLGEAWTPCDYHPHVALDYVTAGRPQPAFRPPGVEVEDVDVAPTTPHTALTLFARDRDGGVDVALRYDTAEIAAAHATEALRRVRAAVEWLALRPERRMADELGPPPPPLVKAAFAL
jgi:hypothetical protein